MEDIYEYINLRFFDLSPIASQKQILLRIIKAEKQM